MTVLAREDRGDLLRWIFSGALVLFAHGGLAAAMVQWSEPIEDAESASAIVIELAPLPVNHCSDRGVRSEAFHHPCR
jgi:hypothetical protein